MIISKTFSNGCWPEKLSKQKQKLLKIKSKILNSWPNFSKKSSINSEKFVKTSFPANQNLPAKNSLTVKVPAGSRKILNPNKLPQSGHSHQTKTEHSNKMGNNNNSQRRKTPRINTHLTKKQCLSPQSSNSLDNSKTSEELEFDPRSPAGNYFSRTPIAKDTDYASFLQMSNQDTSLSAEEFVDPRSPGIYFARTPVTKESVGIDFENFANIIQSPDQKTEIIQYDKKEVTLCNAEETIHKKKVMSEATLEKNQISERDFSNSKSVLDYR